MRHFHQMRHQRTVNFDILLVGRGKICAQMSHFDIA